jgi:NADPH2 dehydrogenase
MVEYYDQRASVPGTLLITEGTFLSARAGGYRNVPGVYTQEHIEAWRKVTEAVHEKGCFIFCQLWSLGRAADPEVAAAEGFEILSSSPNPIDTLHAVPRPMEIPDIESAIEDYAQAARNAIVAGFDGVELHGANGYIIDQFLQDRCNGRQGQYGGNIVNRSRFGIDVVQAVVSAVGAKRTAIRLSPWSTFNGMRMEETIPQFSHFIRKLNDFGLAYLHLVESRIAGNADVEQDETLDFALDLWSGPTLLAGGYTPISAKRLVDKEKSHKDIVVVFGRHFISTPDLPFRIYRGLDLNPYNRDTFYTPKSSKGYIDYPFSEEFMAEKAKKDVAPAESHRWDR